MLKLHEPLRICLLALISRYPDCLIAMNQELLDLAGSWQGVQTAQGVLQELEAHTPELLDAPACLLIDDQQAQSALYLLDRSRQNPAFFLYCGKVHCMRHGRHLLHEPHLVLSDVVEEAFA